MPLLPTSPTPLFPVQPHKTEQFPKPEGSAVFGKPFLKFPEVKPAEPKSQPLNPDRSPLDDFLEERLKDFLKPQKESLKAPVGFGDLDTPLGKGPPVLGRIFDTLA